MISLELLLLHAFKPLKKTESCRCLRRTNWRSAVVDVDAEADAEAEAEADVDVDADAFKLSTLSALFNILFSARISLLLTDDRFWYV
jgi:hypothetical protein